VPSRSSPRQRCVSALRLVGRHRPAELATDALEESRDLSIVSVVAADGDADAAAAGASDESDAISQPWHAVRLRPAAAPVAGAKKAVLGGILIYHGCLRLLGSGYEERRRLAA
jgi:hypothetical protein